MNLNGSAFRRTRSTAPPRVGLYGLLGSGNLGNDSSMEAMLRYLRTDHPDAILDAMCMGPETLRVRYGIQAIPMLWYAKHEHQASGLMDIALKILGKGVDAFRTMAWVRRHDVVIIPGAGTQEATLQLRASGVPYAMFLACAAGKIFGTKVALVSVGANVMNQRITRWLFNCAARLAFYRSYRDVQSRDAMSKRGIDTAADQVYPDLVFSLPVPSDVPADPRSVGVGVMAYYGSPDDRDRADEIYASYVANMKCFVRWLLDNGRKIRLFMGDACDDTVVQEILADLRTYQPELDPGWVTAEPVSSYADLMRVIAPSSIVVASRYHNVICALKLSKPTISLGYSAKHIALMADAGLEEFCQYTDALDIDNLIEQFERLDRNAAHFQQAIAIRNAYNARRLDEQFTELSRLLFPGSKSTLTSMI